MVGIAPANATEANNQIGQVLRDFTTIRDRIAHFQNWLIANDLKVAPYTMSSADEATLKSAVSGLNTALQAFNMVDVNKCIGMF